MKSSNSMLGFALVGLIGLALFVVVAAPFVTLCSLRVLGVPVPINVWTWGAMAWMHFLVYGLMQRPGSSSQ